MTNQEAINKLIIARNVYDGMGESYKPWVEVIDMAIKALEAQEWIPCSERLPDGKGYVLVTDYGETNIGRRFCGKWWLDYCGDKMKDVTAWMPLPEPHREDGNEDR